MAWRVNDDSLINHLNYTQNKTNKNNNHTMKIMFLLCMIDDVEIYQKDVQHFSAV